MKLLISLCTSLGILLFSVTEQASLPVRHVAASLADTVKKDPETGLVTDGNLYLVKAQCTTCHNSKLILQNRFTRDGWKQKIRWMQKNHNLWDLGETEKPVLDYLEKHYGPTITAARRAPLKDIKWYKLDQ